MSEHEYIESKEFRAPFVRVRGRISRSGQVIWSPCIRTDKGPSEAPIDNVRRPAEPADVRAAAVVARHRYIVDFLDYRGTQLVTGVTTPHWFAKDQEWATFVARLRYHPQTQTVRLRLDEREVGILQVPTDCPCFSLLHPGEDACIDPTGVLHLRWAPHNSHYPMTFFVRYTHNGSDWARPGVNLRNNDYYLDLREMPGGKRCIVQVLATNGYRTSYAQTRHFEVPTKPPEMLLGDTNGPVLFAQGFSKEYGPIVGEQVEWSIETGEIVYRGGTLDTRTLPAGIHQLTVAVRDADKVECRQFLGRYDAATGLLVRSGLGL